jgi:hypothetical protein
MKDKSIKKTAPILKKDGEDGVVICMSIIIKDLNNCT